MMRLSSLWKLFGSVQIVYPEEYMRGVASADFEDSSNGGLIFAYVNEDDLADFKLGVGD
jgi:hypothetical protein